MRTVIVTVLLSWCLTASACNDVTNDIQEVKSKHEQELLAIPGVVSVGIGLGADGGRAIIVGLEQDDEQVKKQLPAELGGFAVISQKVGAMKAQ